MNGSKYVDEEDDNDEVTDKNLVEQKVVEEKSTEEMNPKETTPTIIEQPKVIDSELKPSESPLLDKKQFKSVEGIVEKALSSSNSNSSKKK